MSHLKQTNDDRLRIGVVVLTTAGIPFNEAAWIRSGLTSVEVREEIRKFFYKNHDLISRSDLGEINRQLRNATQMFVLRSYLVELFVDDQISKDEIDTYMRKWADQ